MFLLQRFMDTLFVNLYYYDVNNRPFKIVS